MGTKDGYMPLPSDSKDNDILNWCSEAVKEAEAFLRSQYGYEDIQRTIDYIMGEYDQESGPRHSRLSNIIDNRIGKIALDLIAASTDIKPFWEYRTKNKTFEPQAMMANKLGEAWWNTRNIDLKFSDVIKYQHAAGTGYGHLVYNPDTKDLDLLAEDPRDVLPIRPASLHSIQDCLGVIVRRERTLNYILHMGAKGVWKNTEQVKVDRDSSTLVLERRTAARQMIDRMRSKSSFWKSLFGETQKAHTSLRVPSVDVFTMYIKDDRRNESSTQVVIGEFDEKGPKNSWSYLVEPKQELYPRGRMVIFTNSAILYDGPNPYWHGLFPLIKFTADTWPWSWLGKSPLRDLLPIQEELNKRWRDIADHVNRIGRPGIKVDKNALSRAALGKLDSRQAGVKIRYNATIGPGVELLHEPPLDATVPAFIEDLRGEMDKLSGRADITQLTQLGQIPSSETVEKILESFTPIVRLRSRALEVAFREMATMQLSNFFQFYTTPMRVAVLGPYEGVTFEDFDYDPKNMIPDFIEGSSRPERARNFLRTFTFQIAPGSLLNAAAISRKLTYLQLFRAGVLDIWTLAEELGISGYGSPPDGADTIPKRLKAQQDMGIELNTSPTGRKASAQKMPRQVTKES